MSRVYSVRTARSHSSMSPSRTATWRPPSALGSACTTLAAARIVRSFVSKMTKEAQGVEATSETSYKVGAGSNEFVMVTIVWSIPYETFMVKTEGGSTRTRVLGGSPTPAVRKVTLPTESSTMTKAEWTAAESKYGPEWATVRADLIAAGVTLEEE